jgi:hypothetical protein
MDASVRRDNLPRGVRYHVPGRNVKLNLDFRTAGENVTVIDKGSDFNVYSSTSQGAIPAYGYIFNTVYNANHLHL